MTKTIKICDHCGQEVNWLYPIPYHYIAGFKLESGMLKIELCQDCASSFFEECELNLRKKVITNAGSQL